MGPRQHEEFDELCALAAVGQLPDQDWERLRAHLEYCDVCKESLQSHAQFNSWLTASLLGEADEVAEDSRAAAFDLEAGERRLMDSLGKGQPPKIRSRRSPNAVLIFALALASIASALAWHEHHERTHSLSIASAAPGTSFVLPTASASAPPRPLTQTSDPQRATPSVQSHQQMLENQQLKTQIATLTNQLASGQQEQAALQQQVRTSELTTAALSQQLAQAQEAAVSLRGQMAATTTAAQAQRNQDVRELQLLRTTVEAKNKAIVETEELLAHDRDIRDLMGARNLIIEDIYDVGENGQRKKPVGRIFYTKDQRLLFYGYDLDQQRGLKQSVAFQAWGKNQAGSNVSLGVFNRDEANKRWVLKFNDPVTLARLTSIFVTVEPTGGSEKPTGKRLLNASLRIDPNYP